MVMGTAQNGPPGSWTIPQHKAPSDGANMIPLSELPEIVETLLEIDRVAKARPIVLQPGPEQDTA